ncbi:MAG TPA: glycosyltransferase [Bacteroidales bacterium]|nr:glycosyltransferase [Bacteroidales bacterium]
MKILFLCNKSPWPPREGGPIAMNAMVEGMAAAGHQVKVLAINTNKYQVDVEKIPQEYRQKTQIETVYLDLSIRPVDAFLNLFSNASYHVQRFISAAFRDKLIEILQNDNYDIVQCETLYLSPYLPVIRAHSKAKIVLRAHNIEHLIWQRVAAITSNPLKKIYLKHLATKLKRYELKVLQKYDGIAAITSTDAAFITKFACTTPVTDIPFGIDTSKYLTPPKVTEEFPSLFHIGAMNWMPNEEGMSWFLKEVWPKVHAQFPDLKFYVAGRAMPDWLLNLNTENVEVVGEVDDAAIFIASKAIEVVPLFSGSGIRIKIIEGMALGKAIVSTTIGAEGIRVTHAKDIMLADTADDFAEAISRCVEDAAFCRQLGDNARQLIHLHHNNADLMRKLSEFYRTI